MSNSTMANLAVQCRVSVRFVFKYAVERNSFKAM